MEHDFNVDAFSVSGDETDDDNDESDEPELDSVMNETGDNSEIVDEKLVENKDEDMRKNLKQMKNTKPILRAKVLVDLEMKKDDPMDDEDEDKNANEYEFTVGLDKGTAKAHMPAADQVDKKLTGNSRRMILKSPEFFNPLEEIDRIQLEISVYVKRSYMTDEVSQFGQLSVDDVGKSHNLKDVYGEMKDSATALWRK
ncbi:hypothetical protein R6Q59_030937 [Mikania micrantha]